MDFKLLHRIRQNNFNEKKTSLIHRRVLEIEIKHYSSLNYNSNKSHPILMI